MSGGAMNAERLLDVYEQISEAPDAIARLRRFVLDLAVRGKLVEQDAGDEPASILMQAAKALQADEGIKLKADPLQPGETPFSAPLGWLWTRVGLIALQTGSGSTPRGGKSAYADEGTPFLRSQNIYDDGLRLDDVVFINDETDQKMKRTQVKAKDLLLNITGGSIGRCTRVPDEFAGANVSQHVAIIRTAGPGTEDYLHLLIRSPFFQEFVVGEQTGAGRGGLPKNRMDRIPVPLPPLAEQHRIVAKVNELMALCDRLEEARKTREELRDKLTAASLARLTAPDTTAQAEPAKLGTGFASGSATSYAVSGKVGTGFPSDTAQTQDDFPTHAAFALEALPALTTRPDQIKTVRQTILNLAVRGKLVRQDPTDGSGDELLTNILAVPWEKTRKALELEPDEAALASAFLLPPNWTWATVQALTRLNQTVTYGILKPEWMDDGVPTVRVTEMKTGEIDVSLLPRCRPERAAKFAKTTLEAGDLLVSKDGTIGKTAFVPPELVGGNITQHVLRFPICEQVDRRFVRLAIDAPFCQSWMDGETKGVALQGVNVGDFRRMPIPLPPLAEQHRIVAKVDALMALCNRLEATLTTADTTRTRLLEALLHKALEPVQEALETAE